MAALSADRKILTRAGVGRALSALLATNVVCYQGGLVAMSATGYAGPATTTAGTRVIGWTTAKSDNTGGADGAVRAGVSTGSILLDNDATNPITQASVGRHCYVKDDHTVQTVVGSTVVAGIVEELDSQGRGVWVNVDPAVANVTGATVGTVADNNTSAGIPIEHVFVIADAASADYDIVITEKFEVQEVIVRKSAAGAANTVTIKNGATAITDAIAAAVDKAVTRAGTIDPAQEVVLAGGTLRASVVRAAGSGAMKVTVIGRKVA